MQGKDDATFLKAVSRPRHPEQRMGWPGRSLEICNPWKGAWILLEVQHQALMMFLFKD